MIKLNGREVEIGHFPDKTILIKETGGYGENVITWNFENNEELMVLICLTRHLQDTGKNDIVLNMPYIPNARQDRVKGREDVFTLKYFAEVINSLNFKKVIVLDPHSTVSEALFNRIDIRMPRGPINEALNSIRYDNGGKDILMFYPDAGASKRYSGMIKNPYCFGIKKRNWETGEIEDLDIAGEFHRINNADILIVDDICSKGGTFLHSARKLKKLGANRVYLYITHCENTILEGELINSGLLEHIYTTDSIFTKTHDLIDVYKIS